MQPKAVHEAAAAASLVWNGDGINLDMRLKNLQYMETEKEEE